MITRTEFEAIQSRLAALEQECVDSRRAAKTWRRLAVCGFILLAGAVFGGWTGGGSLAHAKPDNDVTVEARQFVLKDGEGRQRAVLKLEADGPVLALLRTDNKPAVLLGATKSGGTIQLRDTRGTLRAYMSLLGEDSMPQIGVQDEPNKGMMTLGWLPSISEGPLVRVHDENGKPRAIFGMVKADTPAAKPVPVVRFKDEFDRITFTKP